MKSVAMSGSPRANVGKKDAKELRRNGMVPCVLYGGNSQVLFAVDERAFKDVVYTPEVSTVEINVDGNSHKAILKEIQLHPVTDRILHADFQEIVSGKEVTMSLPVKVEGNAAGVRAGGKLLKKMRKLSVTGPIEKMPDSIVIDVTELGIGGAIRVADMKAEGLTFNDPENVTIITVRVTRNVVEETPAAAPAKAAAAPAAAKPAADAKKK